MNNWRLKLFRCEVMDFIEVILREFDQLHDENYGERTTTLLGEVDYSNEKLK